MRYIRQLICLVAGLVLAQIISLALAVRELKTRGAEINAQVVEIRKRIDQMEKRSKEISERINGLYNEVDRVDTKVSP